jgi:ribosomal 50S subunit-recycling heat shock protein
MGKKTPDPFFTVGQQEVGVRLDKFLADVDRLGSRSRAASAIEHGKVFVNDDEKHRSPTRAALSSATASACVDG